MMTKRDPLPIPQAEVLGKVLRPVFGKPCYDCEEQVPMARVRLFESDAIATGNIMRAVIRCVSCQSQRDNAIRRARCAERSVDVMIIKGR